MKALKVLIRLGVSFVLGWLVMVFTFYLVSAATGLTLWGLFHTGAPLIAFPFFWALAFWALGFWVMGRLPWFRESSVQNQTTIIKCSRCSGEIGFNVVICPHCGLKFGALRNDA